MTIAVTDRINGASNTSSADIVTGSWTPAAGSVLLLNWHNSDGAITSVSGHHGGAAWVRIGSTIDWASPATDKHSELWACFVGGSPSNGAVTITRSYNWRNEYMIYELTGVDTSGSVANAFGTLVGNGGYDQGAITHTLGAFRDANSAQWAYGAIYNDASGCTWPEGTMTTGTTRNNSGGGSFWAQAAWRVDTTDNTVQFTPGTTYKQSGSYAVEVKGAGGAAARRGMLLGVG